MKGFPTFLTIENDRIIETSVFYCFAVCTHFFELYFFFRNTLKTHYKTQKCNESAKRRHYFICNMPRTANIRDDENLANEVQKYPCIYDKTDQGHKEKDRVENAWKEVDKASGFPEGKTNIL